MKKLLLLPLFLIVVFSISYGLNAEQTHYKTSETPAPYKVPRADGDGDIDAWLPSYTNTTDAIMEQSGVQDDDLYIGTDEIRARDGDGLKIYDDDGNGLFVEDEGQVGIGTNSPSKLLTIQAASGNSADIRLIANAGEKSQDDWRITSEGNGLKFQDNFGRYPLFLGYNAGVHVRVGTGADYDFQVENSIGNRLFTVQGGTGNIGISTIDQFGGGDGVIGIQDADTNPSSNPTNGIVLYSDGGELKARDSEGNVSTLTANEPEYPNNLTVSDTHSYAVKKDQMLEGKRTWRAENRAFELLQKLAKKEGLLGPDEYIIIHQAIKPDTTIKKTNINRKKYWKEQYRKTHKQIIDVTKAEALETVTVQQKGKNEVEGGTGKTTYNIEYKLKNGQVVQVKKPIKSVYQEHKVQIKDGYELDKKTGTFTKVVYPTEAELEQAAKDNKSEWELVQ